jgi:hypothetical protein
MRNNFGGISSVILRGGVATLSVVIAISLSGCNNQPAQVAPAQQTGTSLEEEHDHGAHGPHDGDIVELGGGEYHAEVVHNHDAQVVTVYLFDEFLKKAAPVATESITINLTVDGKPSQFKLPAAPESGDPTGTSARFELKDAALCEALDAQGVDARLSVMIQSQAFTGTIEHAGHDHEHEHDHEGHKH